MQRLVKAIATCGGIGNVPVIPGTAASLIGVCLYFLLGQTPTLYAILTACVVLLSFAVAPKAEKAFGKKDDGRIVIDEVAGQMVSFLFLPVTVGVAVWGFVLFRLFDMFKPPPIGAIEARWGPAGITADDIGAGIYTLLLLQVARLIF